MSSERELVDYRYISNVIYDIIRVPLLTLMGRTKNRMIYITTEGGTMSIWSMNFSGEDRRKCVQGPIHGVARPRPTSPYVMYTRDVTKGMEQHKVFYMDANDGEERLLVEMDPMRIFSMTFDGSSVAFVGATAKENALYLAGIGGSLEKLCVMDTIAFVSDIEDRYIVGFGNMLKNPYTYELFIYDISKGEYEVYSPKKDSQNKYPQLRNGKILFESNHEGKNRLYILDPETKEIERVKFQYKDYEEFDPIEHGAYGWVDGEKIWAEGKKNGRSRLFVDGKEIDTPRGTIHGFPVFIEDKIYLTVSNLLTPPKIIEINTKENKTKTIYETPIPEYIREKFKEVKFVKYQSYDGLEIPMFIILSNTKTPGPTVLYIHGGPWAEVMDCWSISIPMFVAMGFHVLAPNFRGSTGYGDDFRNADIGDPGGGDLQDIVHAARWAIENNIADPEKIAIYGYSYGGYMTYLAMGKHPELWRCGVAGAGVVDWEKMYNLSDAIFRQFIEVLFAGKKELWRERSPIEYGENIKKPICIIHPQNDTRCPLVPLMDYIQKLIQKKATFEVHILPDIGHAIVSMEDLAKIMLPTLIFLKKMLS